MRNNGALDADTILAALAGYRYQKAQIEAHIADLQKRIGAGGAAAHWKAAPAATPKRRKMSAAARKRIGAAQRKRWAAFHKAKAK